MMQQCYYIRQSRLNMQTQILENMSNSTNEQMFKIKSEGLRDMCGNNLINSG